ncbi:MAG: vitamin K epoxide reductase family protein [Candidatus Micrarchaeia archaeon]
MKLEAITLLALGGVLLSAYLTWDHYQANGSACGIESCDTINRGTHSEIYGIPVAVIGVLGYAAIALTAGVIRRLKRNGRRPEKSLRGLLLLLAAGGFAFTLYLVYLQLFVIKATCPFCALSALDITAVFVLSASFYLEKEKRARRDF